MAVEFFRRVFGCFFLVCVVVGAIRVIAELINGDYIGAVNNTIGTFVLFLVVVWLTGGSEAVTNVFRKILGSDSRAAGTVAKIPWGAILVLILVLGLVALCCSMSRIVSGPSNAASPQAYTPANVSRQPIPGPGSPESGNMCNSPAFQAVR